MLSELGYVITIIAPNFQFLIKFLYGHFVHCNLDDFLQIPCSYSFRFFSCAFFCLYMGQTHPAIMYIFIKGTCDYYKFNRKIDNGHPYSLQTLSLPLGLFFST